jgi:PPOX class probable F420-dependent enzyme
MSVKSWASEHFFAILRGPHTGVLTTFFSVGSAWSTPVWFLLDGDVILLSTAAGKQKPRNVAPNARTTFAVCDPENEMRFIEVRGTITITVTDDFVCDIRDRIVQKHGDENGSALDAPGMTLHRRRSSVPSTVIFSPS